jgi:hypothetical protein
LQLKWRGGKKWEGKWEGKLKPQILAEICLIKNTMNFFFQFTATSEAQDFTCKPKLSMFQSVSAPNPLRVPFRVQVAPAWAIPAAAAAEISHLPLR